MNARTINIVLGWLLLVASLIGWPLSAVWFAKDEPQTVLALSWAAIIISAATFLVAAYVHKDEE
jgi:uncharacterized membrane protein YfcA